MADELERLRCSVMDGDLSAARRLLRVIYRRAEAPNKDLAAIVRASGYGREDFDMLIEALRLVEVYGTGSVVDDLVPF